MNLRKTIQHLQIKPRHRLKTQRLRFRPTLIMSQVLNVSGELGNQRHFVLCSIAIYEDEIYRLTTALNKIQQAFFPTITFPIPFHANEVRGGSEFFRKVPKKNSELIITLVELLINNIFQ